jgi:hypothetical protein
MGGNLVILFYNVFVLIAQSARGRVAIFERKDSKEN